MFKKSNIRSVVSSDLAKLKTVLDDTDLFPSEFLEGMLNPFFNDPNSTDYWRTYEHNGQPVALLFCEQERMTESTWNVLAIAVSPALQGNGIGELLMSDIEETLKDNKQSTLIVETSGLAEFERTRKFYDNIGFNREAVIRDFYAQGDDKVIFWKSLR